MFQTNPVEESAGARAEAMPPRFVSFVDRRGMGGAWVEIAGELDVATAPELERTLRQALAHAPLVVLDLRGLNFIDSSGVQAILTASARARRAGRRFILVRGPAQVDRVFTLSGTSEKLEIGDLDSWEPPVQVLLQLAEGELPC